MSEGFDHERLEVYRAAIMFVAWVGDFLDGLQQRNLAVRRQLDSASTSVPLNIAEGNGKRSASDRCRYLDIARGSALESAACLDVLVARRAVEAREVAAGKVLLVRVVAMLTKLIERLGGAG